MSNNGYTKISHACRGLSGVRVSARNKQRAFLNTFHGSLHLHIAYCREYQETSEN